MQSTAIQNGTEAGTVLPALSGYHELPVELCGDKTRGSGGSRHSGLIRSTENKFNKIYLIRISNFFIGFGLEEMLL